MAGWTEAVITGRPDETIVATVTYTFDDGTPPFTFSRRTYASAAEETRFLADAQAALAVHEADQATFAQWRTRLLDGLNA